MWLWLVLVNHDWNQVELCCANEIMQETERELKLGVIYLKILSDRRCLKKEERKEGGGGGASPVSHPLNTPPLLELMPPQSMLIEFVINAPVVDVTILSKFSCRQKINLRA